MPPLSNKTTAETVGSNINSISTTHADPSASSKPADFAMQTYLASAIHNTIPFAKKIRDLLRPSSPPSEDTQPHGTFHNVELRQYNVIKRKRTTSAFNEGFRPPIEEIQTQATTLNSHPDYFLPTDLEILSPNDYLLVQRKMETFHPMSRLELLANPHFQETLEAIFQLSDHFAQQHPHPFFLDLLGINEAPKSISYLVHATRDSLYKEAGMGNFCFENIMVEAQHQQPPRLVIPDTIHFSLLLHPHIPAVQAQTTNALAEGYQRYQELLRTVLFKEIELEQEKKSHLFYKEARRLVFPVLQQYAKEFLLYTTTVQQFSFRTNTLTREYDHLTSFVSYLDQQKSR